MSRTPVYSGRLTRIHVNGGHIKHNKKAKSLKDLKPVFTVKDYLQNRKGNYVEIQGPATVVYRPTKKQRSGAVAWIETRSVVRVV